MKREERRQAARQQDTPSASGQPPMRDIGDVPIMELEALYCRAVRTCNRSQQEAQAIDIELAKREAAGKGIIPQSEEKELAHDQKRQK